MKKAIQIDVKDNVAIITSNVEAGEYVEVIDSDANVILKIKIVENIVFGHKIAIQKLKRGEEIIKYGEIIGVSSETINTGRMVHTHNVNSVRLPIANMSENND